MKKKFELLSPVSSMEMALAAIHNGSDSIYVGFPGFNARGRTQDFEMDDLNQIMKVCHQYGVKVNIALNIVIFENEFEKLIPVLIQVISLKPDALIVQDLGLASLIRKIAPQQVLHASTQMTVTNTDSIDILEDLNFKRFVLGRENSLEEIKSIRSQTSKELEVFVHGALCVAYSGQCFTSESIGGRSANRGQCAQSCRLAYELYVDGEKKDLRDKQYLVSPKDLCGINEIPKLIDIGVDSFKIEGRLKSAEYVGTTAKEYRKAILNSIDSKTQNKYNLKSSMQKMATTYSRGFFHGWLHGVNHQNLVDGTYSAHRGYFIGKVSKVLRNSIHIQLHEELDLKAGYGLLFAEQQISFSKDKKEKGSFIFNVNKLGSNLIEVELSNQFQLNESLLGNQVYLNHDHELSKEISLSYSDRQKKKQIPVGFTLHIFKDCRIQLELNDDNNNHLQIWANDKAQEAKTKGLNYELIKEELASLTESGFHLSKFNIQSELDISKVFIPQKTIKILRQESIKKLIEKRSLNNIDGFECQILSPEFAFNEFSKTIYKKNEIPNLKLNILLRTKEQVFTFCCAVKNKQLDNSQINFVILDFEFGRHYESSLEELKNLNLKTALATTRILKPNEYNNLSYLVRLNPDAILVRNLGALNYFIKKAKYSGQLLGDFSLNVTNHISAFYLFNKGLASITASYDLNTQQMNDLLRNSDSSKLEVTIHQYMPSFHMEHCVFAAFLSQGSSFKDCGKPCEKHHVELKDQLGNRHHIKADQECRNTMFNAIPQSASKQIEEWKKLGLGFIRFEALNEEGDLLVSKLQAYIDLLSEKIKSDELFKKLGVIEKYGLGEGQLSKQKEYQSRKK